MSKNPSDNTQAISDMAEDRSEGIPWGKGERDNRLFEELFHLYSSNKRYDTDAQTKAFLLHILKKKSPVWVMHTHNSLMNLSKTV